MNYTGNESILNVNQLMHSGSADYLSNDLAREINSYLQEFQRLPNDSAKYMKFSNDVISFERDLVRFQNELNEFERYISTKITKK